MTRNRVKRRLRHTVRDVRFQTGMDYVIIARKSAVGVAYPKLIGWIARALTELSDV